MHHDDQTSQDERLIPQTSTQRPSKLPATKHRRHRRRVNSLLHSFTRHDELFDGLEDDGAALHAIKKERVVRDDLILAQAQP